MTWNEELHPRGHNGKFTHASVGAWAKKAADQLGRLVMRSNQHHPPGHAEARDRLDHLWRVPEMPGRTERTDAEQAELEKLEHAFETYRESLGLEQRNNSDFVDERNQHYNQYGERVNRTGGYSRAPSVEHRNTLMERRRGDLRGSVQESWTVHRGVGSARRELPGSNPTGYAARSEMHEGASLESAKVFVKAMHRVQSRARVEQPKGKVRRTPRGTRVENWMMG